MPNAPVAQQVTDVVAEHGEGPYWLAGDQRLLLVDMFAGDLIGYTPATGDTDRVHVSSVTSIIRQSVDGRLLVATERDVRQIDSDGGTRRILPTNGAVLDDRSVRFNDGTCTPDGDLLCGTMAYDGSAGAGTVYRLTPTGSVSHVLERVTVSNGIAFCADGERVYYVDSATGRVDSMSYRSGRLHDRRPFATVRSEDGQPDGIAVDRDDGVWVALWGGGAVVRYDRDGRLTDRITLPARQVTACAFGGPDLLDLYITTSRHGLDSPEPEAGALFRARVSVPGARLHRFGGA